MHQAAPTRTRATTGCTCAEAVRQRQGRPVSNEACEENLDLRMEVCVLCVCPRGLVFARACVCICVCVRARIMIFGFIHSQSFSSQKDAIVHLPAAVTTCCRDRLRSRDLSVNRRLLSYWTKRHIFKFLVFSLCVCAYFTVCVCVCARVFVRPSVCQCVPVCASAWACSHADG